VIYKDAVSIVASFNLVIRRKHANIELVVIDGNSTDGAQKDYLSINR